MTSTARRLLVSVPTLNDQNFFRSVVFIIEHNDDGAVGVVLNQPTDARLVDTDLVVEVALDAPGDARVLAQAQESPMLVDHQQVTVR